MVFLKVDVIIYSYGTQASISIKTIATKSGGAFMKIYAYNEYSLLFLKLIMYKRKINFALIIIIDAKIIKRTN